MSNQHFYVTTPIYYVNDRPHIGHVYTTTIADIVARYQRLAGREVFFLTGTDEHAAKVVDAAAARGLTAQAWADRNAAEFEATFKRLGMSNSDFIRTSEERHKSKVSDYVSQLVASGDVYLGEYEGWYDAGQEEYVPENKAKEQDYKSAINGQPLQRRREKNYFFRLSHYAGELLSILESGQFAVQPIARRNEVVARIREGLNDVPISRAGGSAWGIHIPGDEDHVIYVWIDALFNYLSTIDRDDRRAFWPADVHLIAKDILWFHAVIWPALLMALRKLRGNDWIALPACVYAHSFWIAEGMKMSKSLGNFIDLERIDRYVETFSLDALRYFLASNGPMGTTDSDFAESKFIEVYNSDLANTLGNCVSRVSNMTARYFEGKIPAIDPAAAEGEATGLSEAAASAVARSRAAYEKLDLAGACDAAMSLIRAVDSYIEVTKPFKLAKDPASLPAVGNILHQCAEAVRIGSLLLWPVMPSKAQSVWELLGLDQYAAALADSGRGNLDAWLSWGQLEAGTALQPAGALFPRHKV